MPQVLESLTSSVSHLWFSVSSVVNFCENPMNQLRPALISVLLFTLLTGLLFPAVVAVLAKVAFPSQAEGSLIRRDGKVIGSTLIGQNFASPKYFHPRPSAAGSGYDGSASSGTNLGPTSKKFLQGIEDDPKTKDTDESFAGINQLAEAYRQENNLPASTSLPADAVTRSASGLDPHISPANALLQAGRVAQARGLSEEKVRQMIASSTQSPDLGVLGEARVNVLKLNMALDAAR